MLESSLKILKKLAPAKSRRWKNIEFELMDDHSFGITITRVNDVKLFIKTNFPYYKEYFNGAEYVMWWRRFFYKTNV